MLYVPPMQSSSCTCVRRCGVRNWTPSWASWPLPATPQCRRSCCSCCSLCSPPAPTPGWPAGCGPPVCLCWSSSELRACRSVCSPLRYVCFADSSLLVPVDQPLVGPQILSHLYPLHGGVTSSPLHSALSSGSLAAAVCQMAQHDLSSSIILALLELCVAKHANLTGEAEREFRDSSPASSDANSTYIHVCT